MAVRILYLAGALVSLIAKQTTATLVCTDGYEAASTANAAYSGTGTTDGSSTAGASVTACQEACTANTLCLAVSYTSTVGSTSCKLITNFVGSTYATTTDVTTYFGVKTCSSSQYNTRCRYRETGTNKLTTATPPTYITLNSVASLDACLEFSSNVADNQALTYKAATTTVAAECSIGVSSTASTTDDYSVTNTLTAISPVGPLGYLRTQCVKVPSATTCVYTYTVQKNQQRTKGAYVDSNKTLSECIKTCNTLSECIGLDFTSSAQCYLTYSTNTGVLQTQTGTDHYTRFSQCTDASKDPNTCTEFAYFGPQQPTVPGGTKLALINTLDECLGSWNLASPDATGFTFSLTTNECTKYTNSALDTLQASTTVISFKKQTTACDANAVKEDAATANTQTFEKFSDRHTIGGTRQTETTLAACQAKCLSAATCTHFDWDQSDTSCWFQSVYIEDSKMAVMSGTDSYRRIWTTNGCVYHYHQGMRSAAVFDTKDGVTSQELCQNKCSIDAFCHGVQYASTTKKCDKFPEDESNQLVTDSTTHYFKKHSCDSGDAVCSLHFETFSGQKVNGGSLQVSVQDSVNCDLATKTIASSVALDFNTATNLCFMHYSPTLERTPDSSVVHKALLVDCTHGTLAVKDAMYFGEYKPTTTTTPTVTTVDREATCIAAAMATSGKTGYSYKEDTQQCTVFGSTADWSKTVKAAGTRHVRLDTNPLTTTVATTTTATTTTSTTSTTTTTTQAPTTTTTLATAAATTAGAGSTIAPGCSAIWLKVADVHKVGGIRQASIDTLAKCQELCATSADCVGLDWVNAKLQCWLLLEGYTDAELSKDTGTDNYRKYCDGCQDKYISKTNFKRSGAMRDAADTVAKCQSECSGRTSCPAMDWDKADNTCWLFSSDGVPFATTENVDHYLRERECESSQFNYRVNLRRNGTPVKSTTAAVLDECMIPCDLDKDCHGIEWTPTTKICNTYSTILATSGSTDILTAAAGTNYYEKTGNVLKCETSYKKQAGKKVNGGELQSNAQSDSACKQACDSNVHCLKYDLNTFGSKTSCYLILDTNNNPIINQNAAAEAVTHNERFISCTGECEFALVGAMRGPTDGTNIAVLKVEDCAEACGSAADCATFTWNHATDQCHWYSRVLLDSEKVVDYNYYMYLASSGCGTSAASTTSTTASTTASTTTTVATTTTPTTTASTTTPTTTTPTTTTPTTTTPTTTTTEGTTTPTTTTTTTVDPCPDTYKAYPNKKIAGGVFNAANTLDACKAACSADDDCSSIDFNIFNNVNQCWVIAKTNTNSRQDVGSSETITNYVKSNSCAVPTCTMTYFESDNKHIPGGTLLVSAVTLDVSKTRCSDDYAAKIDTKAACNGFDYDKNMYILTAEEVKGGTLQVLNGVNHYRLQYDCADQCYDVYSGFAPSTPGTAQAAPSTGAWTRDACLLACTGSCKGVMWVSSTKACHYSTTDVSGALVLTEGTTFYNQASCN